jgi:predicted acylesterase/phospholipase RssA
MTAHTKRYKILALDGGANWSLLQCMALDALYPGLPGRQLLAQFDIVAANSGGSLVLAGLLKNQTAAEVLATFDHPDSPTSLFVKLPLLKRLGSLIGLGPKYSTAKKRERIQASLGAIHACPLRNLGDLFSHLPKAPKIFIVAFDYDRLRAVFFRSFKTVANEASSISLTDAINASSTAPVAFFDKPAIVGGQRYWDGAIGGYNNPIMAAVTEALVDGAATADMIALSLGTGVTCRVPFDHPVQEGPRDFFVPRGRACLLADIRKLAGSILDEPPDAALYSAHVALGNAVVPGGQQPPATLVRLNPSIQPVLSGTSWTAPGGLTRYELKALMNLPAGLSTDDDVIMVRALGQKWIQGLVPNEPIRRTDDLGCLIGDKTFQAGRDRWLAFDQTSAS